MTNVGPLLPAPRGEVSAHILDVLAGRREPGAGPAVEQRPLDDDDQMLALYCLQELSYRGFAEVDENLECHPAVVGMRGDLERSFLTTLRDEVPAVEPGGLIADALRDLIDGGGDGPSLSGWLVEHGDHEHMREQSVLRSLYQLKEADPHSWALPRLSGAAKAALARIQFDEYGEGVQRDMHAELFGLSLDRLGLDSTYGAYLDAVPGSTLASNVLVTLFGQHRRWRGALVGHLAMFEMASVPVMSNIAMTLRRLGYDDWTCLFYDVHVVADAEHQTIAAEDLAGGLIADEPHLAGDVLWGATALGHVEAAVTRDVLGAWEAGGSALREPVVARPAPGLHEQRGVADDPRLDPDDPRRPAAGGAMASTGTRHGSRTT